MQNEHPLNAEDSDSSEFNQPHVFKCALHISTAIPPPSATFFNCYPQVIIGEWIQEEEPSPGHITIYIKNDELFMEKIYRDGSAGSDKIIEQSAAQGRRFMHEKRTGPKHEYYLLDRLGNLQLWSMEIDGSFVLVTTAKKK
ncbi:MAG: hypothetical protein COA78_21645 [Blastopirellula sp.]|nr:MAG: hypothetical protein COA78_21645 [Blastopirellula sp.]